MQQWLMEGPNQLFFIRKAAKAAGVTGLIWAVSLVCLLSLTPLRAAASPAQNTPRASATGKPPAKAGPAKAEKPVAHTAAKLITTKQSTGKAIPLTPAATPGTPAAPAPRPVYTRPLNIYVLEGVDRNGLVSGISEEGRFVWIQVASDTPVRLEGEATSTATPAAIRDGMRLSCWGAWDTLQSGVLTARGIQVRGQVDDYTLRQKINEACSKAARSSTLSPAATAPAPTSERGKHK